MYALCLLDYLQIVKGIKRNLVLEPSIRRLAEDYSRLQGDAITLPNVSAPGGPCMSGARKLFGHVPK